MERLRRLLVIAGGLAAGAMFATLFLGTTGAASASNPYVRGLMITCAGVGVLLGLAAILFAVRKTRKEVA